MRTQFKPFYTAPAFTFLLLALYGCADSPAQRIVDAGIQAHGGNVYHRFMLAFDFRDKHYTASRNGGIYSYTRSFTDTTGRIRDVLTNDGFTRYHNDSAVSLSAERSAAFTRSVNSVLYFALLPMGLNDDAVNKVLLGETVIHDEPYHVIRVTFDPDGGGEDHQDVFLYWFHKDKKTMDYLAYSYETEGGGLRFRQAVNQRKKGGMLLQDYINYKPKDTATTLEQLDALFVSGALEKLSEIRIENATVTDYP